jgi:DNA-binding transcriptional ArsR family regulator
VLRALSTGATTSEIAQRLAISPASASEHATVLRNAGLIASGRERNTVIHALTPLGQTLLEGCAGRVPTTPTMPTQAVANQAAAQPVTAGDPA